MTFQLIARTSSRVNFLITVSSLWLARMCQQIRSLVRRCFIHWTITSSLNPIWRNSRWLPWVNWGNLDWVWVCVIGLSSFQISCSCDVFTESNMAESKMVAMSELYVVEFQMGAGSELHGGKNYQYQVHHWYIWRKEIIIGHWDIPG